MSLPLCPSAQLVASTLAESSEPSFLLNSEGTILYENPAGKRLLFETTANEFDTLAGDPRHSYHVSFFFSFSSPHKPWQDYLDDLVLQHNHGAGAAAGSSNNNDATTPAGSPTSVFRQRFDVNDNGLHEEYDVVCKRTNGTEFPASLRLAKVGSCPCCPGKDVTYLCAYVTPTTKTFKNNDINPFAREDHSLRCILNASFDPVFSIDEHGIILMTNQAAITEFGWTNQEFVGENISMICGGNHAAQHDTYIRNYMDTGIQKIIGKKRVVPARRKDGTEFPVELGVKEVSCADYGMDQGKVVFVAFLKNLELEKQHEEELQHKVDLMQGMINSSFDPMFQIDQRGIIRIVNNAAVALFGYRREEMIDQNIRMICGGEHAAKHDDYLKHYLQTGQKRVIGRKRQVTARRKDGTEFEIELGVQEVVTKSGEKLFCGFIRDLTRQIMEKRRMRKHEQNVKNRFFGGSGDDQGEGE